jgi:dolichol-phosphate mannosyltransferase
MPAPVYSIVTVTYDEAGNVDRFLKAIADAVRPLGEPFEIIVVDDNSPDGTGRIVEATAAGEVPEARLVTRLVERGIGSAYRRGVDEALGKIIVLMDADFSHPPSELGSLLAGAEDGALTIGARFLRPGDFQTSLIRFLPTRTINLWHRHLLASGVHDHTNGYVAAPAAALRRLIADGAAMGLEPFDRILYTLILVVAARRLGVPIHEVPARYVFREVGETKIPFVRGVRLLFEEWFDSLRLFPYARKRIT